jgi:hypothetical protein
VICRDDPATRARGFAWLLAVVGVLCASEVARAENTDACIAASEKALSLRKAQKLVAARTALSTCAASSCPDPVRVSCQQRLAEVNQAIPSIVFFAKDGAGHDLDEVKITIDGKPYADRLGGIAIVLDPGEHEFRFEVVGEEPVVRRFVLHQTEQNRRESILIGPSESPAPALVPPPTASKQAVTPPESAGAESQGGEGSITGRGQRTAGVVVGIVGGVALGAGAVLGLLSWSAHKSYEQDCGSSIGAPPGLCTAQGVSGEKNAATEGTLATAIIAGGGVAAAAGLVLNLTAPSGPAHAQLGLAPGGIVWSGRF